MTSWYRTIKNISTTKKNWPCWDLYFFYNELVVPSVTRKWVLKMFDFFQTGEPKMVADWVKFFGQAFETTSSARWRTVPRAKTSVMAFKTLTGVVRTKFLNSKKKGQELTLEEHNKKITKFLFSRWTFYWEAFSENLYEYQYESWNKK